MFLLTVVVVVRVVVDKVEAGRGDFVTVVVVVVFSFNGDVADVERRLAIGFNGDFAVVVVVEVPFVSFDFVASEVGFGGALKLFRKLINKKYFFKSIKMLPCCWSRRCQWFLFSGCCCSCRFWCRPTII